MNKIYSIDYRKKFKNHYNIDFSNYYEIHHIDMNHENNDIDNLMILPKELHEEYHKLVLTTAFLGNGGSTRTIPVRIHGNQANSYSYGLDSMRRLLDVLYECSIWYDFKQYLDGKIPNIHGITLSK